MTGAGMWIRCAVQPNGSSEGSPELAEESEGGIPQPSQAAQPSPA